MAGLLQAADSTGSASKDPGAVGRAISDFSLDDLLGLGPDPAPVEGSEPDTPHSDPFQVTSCSSWESFVGLLQRLP